MRASRKDGLIGAALATVAGLLCLLSPLGKGLDNLSYDLPYFFRPQAKIHEAVIVYMDDRSHDALRQPTDKAWDRAIHAELVHRLTEYHARAVVFDIRFDGTNAGDHLLFDAFRAATNTHTSIVLAGTAETATVQGQSAGWQVTVPFHEDLQNRVPWGLAEATGEDRMLRKHFPGVDHVPSLSWRAAELTLPNVPPPTSTRWFNYYGRPGTIPFRSYYDVLHADDALAAAPGTFSNKVVFVGANVGVGFTGGTGTDHFRTPFSRWDDARYPGTEVNATAYLNLARGDWLRRLHPAAELMLVLVVGSLLGLVLAWCRPGTGAALALISAMLLASVASLLVWRQHIWWAWAIGSFLQIPVALGWALLAHTRRLMREKELLVKEISEATARHQSPAQKITSTKVIAPADGQLTIPDHTLLRSIGKGAYGEVWLARNAIGGFHAVKVVYRKNFEEDEPFEREFRGIQKFMPISRSHPGLVHILHVGRNDQSGHIYYVMETADDEVTGDQIDPQNYSPRSLAKDILKRKRLPAIECVQVGLALTAALQHLHSHRLIHRDIKPANIIFVKGQPKFADVGLVTDLSPRGGGASYVGTEGYIPPEGPGTASADVYSLGKVLYEASMGLSREHFPELPETLIQRADSAELFHLNEILLKACDADPLARYQSAGEMQHDLSRALTLG